MIALTSCSHQLLHAGHRMVTVSRRLMEMFKGEMQFLCSGLILIPFKIQFEIHMPTTLTKIAELNFDEESSVLHIRVIEGAEMNLQNTIAHYQAIEKITGGKKYLALVDASEYYSILPEALTFAALPQTIEKRIATAHYQTSLSNKLTLDFYRKFHKPSLAINTFQTKEEATAWLKGRLREADFKN